MVAELLSFIFDMKNQVIVPLPLFAFIIGSAILSAIISTYRFLLCSRFYGDAAPIQEKCQRQHTSDDTNETEILFDDELRDLEIWKRINDMKASEEFKLRLITLYTVRESTNNGSIVKISVVNNPDQSVRKPIAQKRERMPTSHEVIEQLIIEEEKTEEPSKVTHKSNVDTHLDQLIDRHGKDE